MRIVIAFLAYCCGTLKAADVVEAKCSLARNKKFCDEQIELYEEKENKTDFCSPIFNLDILFCQPLTPANTIIKVPCPEYIPRRKYLNDRHWPNITLECLPGGNWSHYVTSEGSERLNDSIYQCLIEIDKYNEEVERQGRTLYASGLQYTPGLGPDFGEGPSCDNVTNCDDITEQAKSLKEVTDFETMIQIVGHALSMISLLISIGILLCFKKLRNTRNFIHVNLMIALFIRGMTFFLQQASLKRIYKSYDESITSTNTTILDEFSMEYCEGSFTITSCRLITVFDHWAMTASFYWLLIEGVQLYTLLVVTVLSVKKYFYTYMAFGWGVSWISVLTWVFCKVNYENRGCWEIYNEPFYEWVIRAPILTSILLNFLIYIILVYVIISKLRVDASRSRESYHLRLARSTLTLIPLMGTEYIIFAFVINDQDLQYIRYKIDLFFVSFQGFFVAVLFCFLNEEVKKEIKKVIRQKCFRYNLNDRRRGSLWDSSMNVTYMYTSISQNVDEEARSSVESKPGRLSKKSTKTSIINSEGV